MKATEQITDIQGKKGQLVQSAADIYESFFIPALFQQWPPIIAELLQVSFGKSLLDVACGTGVFARHLEHQVGDSEQVHGVDINDGMLSVARKKAPNIQWHQGPAEDLRFENESFDYVVCQFGLMFFENRELAIQEMVRVLKPGGKLAVAVWDSLENSPGYKTVTQLLQQLFGEAYADEMRAPFILGDVNILRSLFECTGVNDINVQTLAGTATFPSIDDWVFTDIKGWTLADMLSSEQFEKLLSVSRKSLKEYTDNTGVVNFSAPAHIVVWEKTEHDA